MKRCLLLLTILGILLMPCILQSSNTAETKVYPGGTAGYYINSVESTSDGMRIILKSTGVSYGRSFSGAAMLASWSRNTYYQDGGGAFFSIRTLDSLSWEIYFHCWAWQNDISACYWDGWHNGFGLWD